MWTGALPFKKGRFSLCVCFSPELYWTFISEKDRRCGGRTAHHHTVKDPSYSKPFLFIYFNRPRRCLTLQNEWYKNCQWWVEIITSKQFAKSCRVWTIQFVSTGRVHGYLRGPNKSKNYWRSWQVPIRALWAGMLRKNPGISCEQTTIRQRQLCAFSQKEWGRVLKRCLIHSLSTQGTQGRLSNNPRPETGYLISSMRVDMDSWRVTSGHLSSFGFYNIFWQLMCGFP